MGLQQLGGSRGGSRRPSLQPSILARGRDLWRASGAPSLGVRRAFALRGPEPGTPGTLLAVPAKPSQVPPAGQQALTNKRPVSDAGLC